MPNRSLSGLPPGQRERPDFPRFGLLPFARRFPRDTERLTLSIGGDVREAVTLEVELRDLPRVEQVGDLHCVTTWTKRGLRWSGFRFKDLYESLILPRSSPSSGAELVALRGQDGYRTTLPLEDLLHPEVIFADHLDGEPLSVAHGAPLRLIAPACYGYKNLKHLNRIDFLSDPKAFRPLGPRILAFMAHPRARVEHEERGQWLPGWLLRHLYRPLINPVVARFKRAIQEREVAHLANFHSDPQEHI